MKISHTYPFSRQCSTTSKFLTRRKFFRVSGAKLPAEGIPMYVSILNLDFSFFLTRVSALLVHLLFPPGLPVFVQEQV